MLQTAPVDKLTLPGEHTPFRKMCTDMVREWTPTVCPFSEDVPEFGDTFELCPASVSMTLTSGAVRLPAALFVPWINHHGT